MRRSLASLWIAALAGCAHTGQLVAPAGGGEAPPQGMAQVDVVSAFAEQGWAVYAGQDQLCATTPCTQWVDPFRPLFLRSNDGDQLALPGLGPEALESQHALLVATGSCQGKYVNGLVWTSFGGMGAVVATTLTAVGCSNLQRRAGMCNAGLITGAVALPLTAFGIWLLIDSGPHADVIPLERPRSKAAATAPSVRVTPVGIAGTF